MYRVVGVGEEEDATWSIIGSGQQDIENEAMATQGTMEKLAVNNLPNREQAAARSFIIPTSYDIRRG
jgi:hypothetical protein